MGSVVGSFRAKSVINMPIPFWLGCSNMLKPIGNVGCFGKEKATGLGLVALGSECL